jgi:prolipoprotein diacylglyceryltransferase
MFRTTTFYWKTDARTVGWFGMGSFVGRICKKKDQGGFEESLPVTSTGQWLNIPFIIIGLYFVFYSENIRLKVRLD